MNVKLRVLSAGALFFIGQMAFAQTAKRDTTTTKEKQIEEVVVLGYGKKSSKVKNNAATVTVDASVLENRPNVSFLSSLQGAAPGVSINTASGSPGSGKIDVIIRGVSSINASTDPLYVIDGLITNSTQFRNLNSQDIENISVLKDAQATAIYGNRGSNGVIVITTKNARYNSGLKISYDALTSFSKFPKPDYNMANSQQFFTLQKRWQVDPGYSMTDDEIANYPINTNWSNEFFRTGISQQHNLGLRFGGENVAVYTSLGYLQNEGIIKATDFKRFTLRNNITGKSKDNRLTYNSQIALGYSKRNQLEEETTSALGNNIVQNPLFGAVLASPALPSYPFINGQDMYNQIGSTTNETSPYVLQDILRGGVKNIYEETSILANINVNYKLTDWLSVGNRTGVDFKQYDRTFARDPRGYLAVVVAASSGIQYGGVESLTNARDLSFNSVTNLTFDKKFGDHSITVTAYLDYLKAHYLAKGMTQNGLNPLNWELGAGTGYIPFNPATPNNYRPTVSASKINAGTLAYFATADYDYAGKYGVSGTIRRDGSYRFFVDNRWDTFWSVAGRWNIDKESFMEGSNVRLLKLRGSYGTTGNQNLLAAANNGNPLFTLPNAYKDLLTSGSGYLNLPGWGTALGNDKLQWEKVAQLDLGLDFAILNNKLEGSFDYYKKKTTGLYNSINLSAITGQASITGNNGSLQNEGYEALLRYSVIKNDNVKVSVYVNGAYNKNTVLGMDTESLIDDNVNAIGGPVGQWNLYHYVGVNHETGEQQFIGANGQITEAPTANDRVLTGKSYLPKYTGGFGLDAEYKGFFASANFSFQAGGWMYDNLYSWVMDPNNVAAGLNASADLLNAWTPTNTGSDIPSLDAVNTGTEGSSDRYLFKSDFIRLKNVSVGYNFTKAQLTGLPITSLRIFAQAENLVTWSKWKGYDPEPINAYSLGIYPNPKTISVGLNVEF